VGGPADALVCPCSAGEIAAIIGWCRQREIPWLIMGNGTNLLIRDGGFRGVVVKLSEHLRDVSASGNCVAAQAGASLASVARAARRASLSGLEFASGIPGTVAGPSQ
jgi:UDP-N-acetylmuramate dehydrogenase